MTFRGLSVKALIILQMGEDEAALLLLLVVEGRVGGKLGIVQQLHHSFLTQAPVTRVTLKGHFFT